MAYLVDASLGLYALATHTSVRNIVGKLELAFHARFVLTFLGTLDRRRCALDLLIVWSVRSYDVGPEHYYDCVCRDCMALLR